VKAHVQTAVIAVTAVLFVLAGDYGIRYFMKTLGEKATSQEVAALSERVTKLEAARPATAQASFPSPLPLPSAANAVETNRRAQVAFPQPAATAPEVNADEKQFKLLTASAESTEDKPKNKFTLLGNEQSH